MKILQFSQIITPMQLGCMNAPREMIQSLVAFMFDKFQQAGPSPSDGITVTLRTYQEEQSRPTRSLWPPCQTCGHPQSIHESGGASENIIVAPGCIYHDSEGPCLCKSFVAPSALDTLIAKVEAYDFHCEGGPLESCTDWIRLKEMVRFRDLKVERDVNGVVVTGP